MSISGEELTKSWNQSRPR